MNLNECLWKHELQNNINTVKGKDLNLPDIENLSP